MKSTAPEIVVHIGLGKTETTSLQAFLRLNRKNLEKHGYCFPEITGVASNGNATPAALALSSDIPNWVFNLNKDGQETNSMFEAFWKQLLNNCPNASSSIIASSEEFESIDPAIFSQRSQFDGKKKKIIVFLRRQDRIIESLYLQLIRYGFTSISIEKFVQETLDSSSYQRITYSYHDLLGRWANAFGTENIIPIIYKNTSENFLYKAFLQALGIDSFDDFIIPEKLNRSMSTPLTIRYLRTINRLGINELLGNKVNQHLAIVDRVTAKLGKKDKTFLLSSPQRQLIMASFLDQNQQVAQQYFESSPADLFEMDQLQDISKY